MKQLRFTLIMACIIATVGMLNAAIPSGYYDSAVGKNKQSLLSALCNIVGSHTTVSYNGLWNVYATSDVRSNGYIWDMYSTSKYSISNTGQRCGNYSAVGDCYNREHSFPKSWFNDASPMYSDAFHIYPTDGKVNGQRSNYPYGECANGSTLPSNNGVDALGKLGSSTFPGYSGTVFEPVDEYKGDFARSYFYMAAAYNNKISGWDSDMLAGNSYPCFSTWALNLLLKWHRNDPVSDKERNRNEAVYAYQNNRNPFIDYPELVEYIWGTSSSMGWTPGGAVEPEITMPTEGQLFDMGKTAVGHAITLSITVKGISLIDDLLTEMTDNTNFALSPTTLEASTVTSSNGATLNVTFKSLNEGQFSNTITVGSGEIQLSFTVKAEALSGIPALDATQVTQDSFIANWVNISGSGAKYTLNVMQNGTSVSGYPIEVNATEEHHTVNGLTPLTTYTYSLTSDNLTSNTVSVTTAAPIPVLALVYAENALNLTALPGEPSQAAEVEIYTEYITEDITATAYGPFEISRDMSAWSSSLTISPDGETIYVRSKAQSEEGTYSGELTLTTASMNGNEADLQLTVAAPRSFIETFENITTGGYWTADKTGTASEWHFENVGVWADTNRHDGVAARFGKSSSHASLTMLGDKLNGAKSIKFWAALWSGDNAPTVDILYSIDGGTNWTKLTTVTIEQSILQQYSFTADITGKVRFKFDRSDGGRFNIDDIEITDNVVSSVSTTSRSDWNIFPAPGGIVVESAKSEQVSVYNTDATLVYEGTVEAGHTTIALDKGIYIVALDDARGRKIVVR